MQMTITFSTDDDGFISQECPACERRFKAVFGEGSDKAISYCPYCDHEGTGCWWTPEQADYIGGTAADQIVGPKLEKMARSLNKSGSNGFIKMSMSVKRSRLPPKPSEPNGAMPVHTFACCNEKIKYDGSIRLLRCVICGQSAGISFLDN